MKKGTAIKRKRQAIPSDVRCHSPDAIRKSIQSRLFIPAKVRGPSESSSISSITPIRARSETPSSRQNVVQELTPVRRKVITRSASPANRNRRRRSGIFHLPYQDPSTDSEEEDVMALPVDTDDRWAEWYESRYPYHEDWDVDTTGVRRDPYQGLMADSDSVYIAPYDSSDGPPQEETENLETDPNFPLCATCQLLYVKGNDVCSQCRAGKPNLTHRNRNLLHNHKKTWREQAHYTLPDLIIDQDDPVAWSQLNSASKLASQVSFFSQVVDANGELLDLDLEVTHPKTLFDLVSEDSTFLATFLEQSPEYAEHLSDATYQASPTVDSPPVAKRPLAPKRTFKEKLQAKMRAKAAREATRTV